MGNFLTKYEKAAKLLSCRRKTLNGFIHQGQGKVKNWVLRAFIDDGQIMYDSQDSFFLGKFVKSVNNLMHKCTPISSAPVSLGHKLPSWMQAISFNQHLHKSPNFNASTVVEKR